MKGIEIMRGGFFTREVGSKTLEAGPENHTKKEKEKEGNWSSEGIEYWEN